MSTVKTPKLPEVGQQRRYFCRSNPDNGLNKPRTGIVKRVYPVAKGTYVTLTDKQTGKDITVRPTQVVR